MRKATPVGVIAAVLAALSACSERTASAPVGSGMEFRMEAYCSVKGLPNALRHTYILIDERVLPAAPPPGDAASTEQKSQAPPFNTAVRDAVLAFSDPIKATQTGVSDYRERVTILLVPKSGAAAEVLFAGCIPGLNPEELKAARDRGSAVGSFFTGGVDQQLANAREEFRGRATRAVANAARNASAGPGRGSEGVVDGPLVASLRASGNLINSDYGLPRVVILSNLARVNLYDATSRSAARKRGFEDGSRAGLDLGRSEIHVFLVEGKNSGLARDYLGAFFLAQQGRLLSWSAGAPSNLPPPPVKVMRFEGKAVIPQYSEDEVQLRIAIDRNNTLVNSWIFERVTRRSTPLTGLQSCDGDGMCSLSSDEVGFAQAWRDLPDPDLAVRGAPEARAEMPIGVVAGGEGKEVPRGDACPQTTDTFQFCVYYPFVGVRSWRFQLSDEGISGALTDPINPQIGPVAGNSEFLITGRETPNLRF